MPKVTVIVPVYNAEPYLEECIASVLGQSLGDLQLVLVNDGSRDGSLAIMEAHAQRDSRVTVLDGPNQGAAAARNRGIDVAEGDYLYFLDADDYLLDGSLEAMHSEATSFGADVVMGDYLELVRGNENPKNLFDEPFFVDEPERVEELRSCVLYGLYARLRTSWCTSSRGIPTLWNYLIRTSIVTGEGLRLDEVARDLFEDGLFLLDVLKYARSVRYGRFPVVAHRIVAGSLMHGYKPDYLERIERTNKRIADYIEGEGSPSLLVEANRYHLLSYLMVSCYDCLMHPENHESERVRYAKFVALASSRQYREMARKIDLGRLISKKTCILIWFLRLRAYRLFWLAKRFG